MNTLKTHRRLPWEDIRRICDTAGAAGLAGRSLSDRFNPTRKYPLVLNVHGSLDILGSEGAYLGRSLGHSPETILRHLETGDWFIHDEKPAGAAVSLKVLGEVLP